MNPREQATSRNAATPASATVHPGPPDLIAQLTKLEETNLSIRRARDLLLTRNHALIAEMARAEDKIAEMTFEAEDAQSLRVTAETERDELTAECDKLRREAAELRWQVTALTQADKDHETEIKELRETIAELGLRSSESAPDTQESNEIPEANPSIAGADKREVAILVGQLMTTQHARDAALRAAEDARNEHHATVVERENLREELAKSQEESERQIATLRAEIAELTENAQTEAIRADAAGGRPESEIAAGIEARLARNEPTHPLDSNNASAALERICGLMAALEQGPSEAKVAEALDDEFRIFCEAAHAAGMGAVHRLAMACRELTRALRKSPEKMARSLPTLNEALGLLSALTLTKGGEEFPDPAGSLVYAVDDDLDNCECIAAGLEKATLFTKYALKPEEALVELAGIRCDLIILDVNMPGIDGFECCERIRQIEHHKSTPILFVSGITTVQERLGSRGDRIESLSKPYNLSELSLKVLTMILMRDL